MDAKNHYLMNLGITAIAIIEMPSAISGHHIYYGFCVSCGYETTRFLDQSKAVKASSRHKKC